MYDLRERWYLRERERWRCLRERWRWVILAWALMCCLILYHQSSRAVEKQRDSLASMCDERARMLQRQLNASMNNLQALAILVSTFHHSKNPSSAVEQTTFARYAERTVFERPAASGVVYGERVTHAERQQFERQQGWTIKKMHSSTSNKQSPSPSTPTPRPGGDAAVALVREAEEEYAPIIFAQDAYKGIISFDLLSAAEGYLENVLRARQSGKPVLTAPLKLLNNRLGVISTYTVYKHEPPSNARPQERIHAAIGYLGGIFDIEALVDKFFHHAAGNPSIMVNVYETTTGSLISMYGTNDTGSGMCHVSTLNFGDPSRKHEMHCRFIQSPPWPWMAIASSIATHVIALLIGYHILVTEKHFARIQHDYFDLGVLKKRAEDVDIAKLQFLATFVHGMNTPLNGVLGMLQMLMDTDLDTKQDYIRTLVSPINEYINQLIDWLKLESDCLQLEMVPFDVRTVCDDILSIFCEEAQEKGLELAVYVSDQVPQTLIGDPGRIRHVIAHLVGNSIKFTERGHIFLTVHVIEEVMHCLEVETGTQYASTLSGYPVANRRRSWQNFRHFSRELNSSEAPFAPVASDSVSLIISVEDTGVGIPFEAQLPVFTPFIKVNPSIASMHGGTGIKFSMSKCFVELMKGEIGFAYMPQVGSTFTFTAVLKRVRSSGDDNKSSEFKGTNALVIDHRLVRAKVTKYHLQRLGIQTKLTTDLDQYVSKDNRSQTVKLVFIDKETWMKKCLSMPLLVSKLRNKNQPDSPKLFLLENPRSLKSNSHELREYNLNIITKPLRASVLQVSLQRALGGTEKLHCRSGVVGNSTLGSLLHKKQIIIVDDNILCLKVAAGALKKYGAEVTCVDSGKKAITMLKPPHNFDACFMDIQMPGMDGFDATKRIRWMETDINEQIRRGEIPQEFASVRQWRTPILAMTADIMQATHELCLESDMDGYVSKPFEREKLYWECARIFQTNKSSSSLELSYAANHHDVLELEQDEIVGHVDVKLGEAERKLEDVGMRSMLDKKLTSVSVHCLPYRLCYLNKMVVGVSLLGLMLYILVIGTFDLPFNQSLGIRREDENMVLNKSGWSHGRSLIDTLNDAWAEGGVENSDMTRVDLRKMTGNNDSSGQQQQHWYLHMSSKYQEEATEMQNGTVKPHQPAHIPHKTTVGLWIALVSVTVLVLGIAVTCVLLWCNRRKRVRRNELLELSGGIMGPRRFQLCELVAATSNFADENKLGQGGFGPVYKGYLHNQDCHVAIKVLSKTQSSQQQSEQGLREFKAEVNVMTQLRHRNIVNLVGWCECDSQQRLLLVYELMAQGSLDKHLYDPEEILTWQQRYKIALGLGSALLYLHRDCEKCIVHGDIKPANVMLDALYNAKLGDFGLARLVEHGEEPRTTQVVAGTLGYIDPEFIANRWPRAELDVYSFGVVLLEIACGKRPASRQPNGASSLLAWVIRLYDQGMILDAADQRLNGEFDRQQMERVLVTGIWCAHRDPIQRPSIEQAMDVLRSADAELPVLRAVHDERHIRAMEEQAYGSLTVEDDPVNAVTTSTYFTSKDSAYLLAQE